MSTALSRAREAVRAWDRSHPIGTVVILDGERTVTESHAGMGPGYVPCVFVKGVEEPVALVRLTEPGSGKGKKS